MFSLAEAIQPQIIIELVVIVIRVARRVRIGRMFGFTAKRK
jgi:hypothetical protein